MYSFVLFQKQTQFSGLSISWVESISEKILCIFSKQLLSIFSNSFRYDFNWTHHYIFEIILGFSRRYCSTQFVFQISQNRIYFRSQHDEFKTRSKPLSGLAWSVAELDEKQFIYFLLFGSKSETFVAHYYFEYIEICE